MKILLATDGSEHARASANFIKQFPFPKESEVIVLTVIDDEFFTKEEAEQLNKEQLSVLDEAGQAAKEFGGKTVKEEAEQLKKEGFKVTTIVEVGHPADKILSFAEKLQIELIVMGSRGIGGIKQFLLGSVSEKVVNHAECSVLIVEKGESVGLKENGVKKDWQILLAYDESEPARKAVELCASLPFDPLAEITVLTVLPLLTTYRQDIRQHLNKIWHQKKKRAQEALTRVAERLHQGIPKVSTQLQESPDVSEEILSMAEEIEADLIVIGNKGKSGVEKFFLGSVTDRIAKHAQCAVLVVRVAGPIK